METYTEENKLNPWLNILIKPKKTIRQIIADDPTENVLLIVILSAAIASLAEPRLFDNSLFKVNHLPMAILIALISGFIGGPLRLYAGSFFIWMAGEIMHGRATQEEVRAVFAWSQIPEILAGLLIIPQLLIFGTDYILDTSYYFRNITDGLISLWFSSVAFGFIIWELIIFCQALGEAQGFTSWRALGNLILAFIIIIIITLVLGFLGVLLYYLIGYVIL